MSHSINRTYIVESICVELTGCWTPAATPIPQEAPGFNGSIAVHEFDIELARSYMEDAGFDYSTLIDTNNDGDYSGVGDTTFFNFTILTPQGNEDRIFWANYIVAQLPLLGIGVTHIITNEIWSRAFDDEETPTYELRPLFADGGYDAGFMGVTYQDEFNLNNRFSIKALCTATDPALHCYNHINYENPVVSDLTEQFVGEGTDLENGKRIMEEIQQILYDEMPVIPIVLN